MIRAALVLVLSVLIGLCFSTAAIGREPRLKDVLSRLEAYLATYETDLATLVAEEQYEQWVPPKNGEPSTPHRTITSEFGFLRLPGRSEWLGLRDTYAVDGQPVPDHQRGRLDRVLSDGRSNSDDLARRIVEENARYNLGVIERTINVPMLALDVLGRRNQWRLSLRKKREEQLDGRAAWVVTFSERERPTLVKTPQGRDRPVRGTVWIDPTGGSVLRTDLQFDGAKASDSPATTITVRYQRETTLGLLVPIEMRELYRMESAAGPDEIDAVARYTNFRQFRTTARILP
jgi:hypothetical protein